MTKQLLVYFFQILFFGLLLSSCQKEETEFIDDTDPDETITSSSALAGLMMRTAQHPGSVDDLIDGNSCSKVKYPFRVIANGQEVLLESEADLAVVQNIFDQFPADDDSLQIIFPITVVLKDFSEIVINDQSTLDSLIAACEGETEINCIDFVYPIDIFTYNTENEQSGSLAIDSDEELYLLLFGLDETDLIGIDFPISLSLENGASTEVNANQELQTVLANADCGNTAPVEFEENLTTGSWYVTYYFDGYDETGDFSGYEFTFFENNTAQADNGTTPVPGTWNFIDGNSPVLELYFGTNPPFDEFDDDWGIVESTSEIIRLRHVSGGDGSVDYLTFERNPNSGGSNNDVNILIQNLTTGSWFLTLFEENGNNGTSNYAGYEFTFFTNSSVTAMGTSNTINGFWQVLDTGSSLDVVLNFDSSGNGDFENLNDDWEVVESSQIIVRLSDDDSGNGTDLLTFERTPGGGNEPDPQELRDIMQAGTWYVDTFLDNGDDETEVFDGFEFTFFANETVTATDGSENVDGIWIVSVTGDELNFEFDMDSPLNDADDDDYKTLQFSETEVTFILRDSSGNIEDTLIFKKN